MCTVSFAKVTEISVPVRYFMPLAWAAARRAVLAADLVVVGQGPEFDTVGRGALGERFGRQGAVGDDGVAVEIGVEDGGHASILFRIE